MNIDLHRVEFERNEKHPLHYHCAEKEEANKQNANPI